MLQAQEYPAPLKILAGVVVVVVSQAILWTLQRRQKASSVLAVLASGLWFWAVFFLCLTLDGIAFHTGLAKDVSATAPDALLHFGRVFGWLGVPMVLVNVVIFVATRGFCRMRSRR